MFLGINSSVYRQATFKIGLLHIQYTILTLAGGEGTPNSTQTKDSRKRVDPNPVFPNSIPDYQMMQIPHSRNFFNQIPVPERVFADFPDPGNTNSYKFSVPESLKIPGFHEVIF